MEGDIKIIYRVAEKKNKNSKVKPEWVNNRNCLHNLVEWKASCELYVFGDALDESLPSAKELSDKFFKTKNHGNTETFLEVLDFALNTFDWNDIVYFVEDDYIHRPGFVDVIKEGLAIADYVSLYDHPDKYAYDPKTMLHITPSTHWREASSTTMTFACKIKTLSLDKDIFKRMCQNQKNPPDFYIWSYLTEQLNRILLTSIPGYATHGETQWLAPCVNWKLWI